MIVALPWVAACGDDGGGSDGTGPGGSGGGGQVGGTGSGGGDDGPCQSGIITLAGTVGGDGVDVTSSVEGHLITQVSEPFLYVIDFTDGSLGMLWSGGEYAGSGEVLNVIGTIRWGGDVLSGAPTYCFEGTFQRIEGDYDHIVVTGLSEFVDSAGYKEPPICGDEVEGSLDICADSDS